MEMYRKRILDVISKADNEELRVEHFSGICEKGIRELRPINNSLCFSVDDKLIVLIYDQVRACPIHDTELLIAMKQQNINNALIINTDESVNCREKRI